MRRRFKVYNPLGGWGVYEDISEEWCYVLKNLETGFEKHINPREFDEMIGSGFIVEIQHINPSEYPLF
jgi:hypothetical protein